jgi:hypothetical protein
MTSQESEDATTLIEDAADCMLDILIIHPECVSPHFRKTAERLHAFLDRKKREGNEETGA